MADNIVAPVDPCWECTRCGWQLLDDELELAAAACLCGKGAGNWSVSRARRSSSLPPELFKISRLLSTQDNRATAHPIFLVQQKLRIYGVEPGWHGDEAEWLDCDGDRVADDLSESLEAGWRFNHNEPEGFKRVGYYDDWEYVTACFTEAAAQRYIDENRHNLKSPRIYAASGYRNREWIAVLEFLRSLSVADQKEGEARD